MGLLVILLIIAVVLLIVAGILITKGDYDDIIAMACIAMGVFLLGVLIFLAAPQRLPTGAPVTSISAGEYPFNAKGDCYKGKVVDYSDVLKPLLW